MKTQFFPGKYSLGFGPMLALILILVTATSLSLQSQGASSGSKERSRFGEVLVKLDPQRVDGQVFQDARIIREYSFLSRSRGKRYLLLGGLAETGDALAKRIGNLPGVEAVSPNYIRRKAVVPNDPRWGKLWNLLKIEAPESWNLGTGSAGIVIGVIDSGIDYRHEDLAANMWINTGEIAANGIDDDGNGYVDDVHGYDFTSPDRRSGSDPMDAESHGTHVAGISGAVGGNGLGVVGVNWRVRLMALRIMDSGGFLTDADAIEAIEYAVMMKTVHHVPIAALNASWGGGGYNQILKEAIDETEKAGIVFVAASGNGGDDDIGDDNDRMPFYPASYTSANIISVASSDAADQLSDFSNFGAVSVDIAAPGSVILSTYPRGRGEEARIDAAGSNISAYPLEFAGKTPAVGIQAPLINCGQGLSAADFPASVSGAIALIERGEIYFREKVRLAMNAGAAAAVIFNNVAGSFTGTLSEAGDWIPTLSISREDGLDLKNRLPIVVTLLNFLSDYGYLGGTSQAAPHVAGAVALIAALYPQESIYQWMGRILAAADPLPEMADKVRSGGRLNLNRALRSNLLVTLFAARQQGSGWLLTRDAGLIKIYLPDAPPTAMAEYRFILQKRVAGSDFSDLLTIRSTDFRQGVYEVLDKYLDPEKTYTYKVTVVNALGETVGTSSPQSI